MATATPAIPTPSLLPPWLRKLSAQRSLIVPVGFVAMLAVLLVPLPPAMLDVLIALNISAGIVILLTTVYMKQPLDFSVFPSLLLATTLFRLVLNIASTRLILTADASSAEEAADVAGHVIMAFGDFVAGGSLFVGIIIFGILMIVQFMVITKGAGRISEVAARFTLDAMPGKQLAIDSDLSAGIIDDKEARRRREEIRREADFFGSMDGASKFVKGDATAGIIITAINIVGGFAVGMIEKGWEVAQTAEVFTRLTIGDGIASAIPSFVTAIASALIVTRSSSKVELGEELTDQVTSQPRGLIITAGFLALLSLTPLPTIPLLVTAAGLLGIALTMQRIERLKGKQQRAEAEKEAVAARKETEAPPVEELLRVDVMELEVGYALVPLIDKKAGGDLLDRVSAVRRQLAAELGLVMPPLRIRDNMAIPPQAYRVKIRGAVVGSGESRPNRLLAMDPGLARGAIDGEKTIEPAFGLQATWIDPALRVRAETMNYTVVEPSAVLATHITELVKRHADELLTRDEVNNLVAGLKEKSPKLVEEAIPAVVKIGDLQKVLQKLLRERVPIRDMGTIIETLTDWTPRTKDLDILLEYVRHALRRTICETYASDTPGGRRLVCVTLDPEFEDQINAYIDRSAGVMNLTMPARTAARFAEHIGRSLERVTAAGHHPVVIASPQTRAAVRQLLEPTLPVAAVLGYNEVVPELETQTLALVTPLTEAAGQRAA